MIFDEFNFFYFDWNVKSKEKTFTSLTCRETFKLFFYKLKKLQNVFESLKSIF